jgi:hypothetical protein
LWRGLAASRRAAHRQGCRRGNETAELAASQTRTVAIAGHLSHLTRLRTFAYHHGICASTKKQALFFFVAVAGVEKTRDAAIARLRGLYEAIGGIPAFAGLCYTQLTDVEQEVNGLLTYDRKPKFDVKEIKAINDLVR